MNSGRTVFSQLVQHLPEKEFQKCVARHHGDSNFRGFSCWDQLLAMAFAQLTYRESLRDIESCLRALQSKLYHMGFRGKVSRSTLADANESHDWRIFADFAQVLIAIARPLHACDLMGVDLHQSLYALDSTTIDLCLSLFPWAKFRQGKAAVKMHTLLDLHGNIPTFVRVTSGVVHDVNLLDEIMPEAGAFYVMDRAYVDFQRLFVFTLSAAFFVVRTKSNEQWVPVNRSSFTRFRLERALCAVFLDQAPETQKKSALESLDRCTVPSCSELKGESPLTLARLTESTLSQLRLTLRIDSLHDRIA